MQHGVTFTKIIILVPFQVSHVSVSKRVHDFAIKATWAKHGKASNESA